MLPSDTPFLGTALALLALPFRPATAGVLLPAAFLVSWKASECVMPGAHKPPPTLSVVFNKDSNC
jgi:hypothetical protein